MESKKATRDNDLTNITACRISIAKDISNTTFECKSNLVRIAAKTDITVKSSNFGSEGDGLFIPMSGVEYFQVNMGEIITIVGSANVASIC